jgi:hypothetical protein
LRFQNQWNYVFFFFLYLRFDINIYFSLSILSVNVLECHWIRLKTNWKSLIARNHLSQQDNMKIADSVWLVYTKFIFVRMCRKLLAYRHIFFRSWNQPVLNNRCEVSCWRKQRLSQRGWHITHWIIKTHIIMYPNKKRFTGKKIHFS